MLETPAKTPLEEQQTTLHRLLADKKSEPFLHFDGQTLTFAQIADRSNALAHGLKSLGFAKGDRLAVWLPNGPAWIATLLACSSLGVCVVSLNLRWGSKEVGDILTRTACRGIVLSHDLRDGACAASLRAAHEATKTRLQHVISETPSSRPILADVAQNDLPAICAQGGPWIDESDPASDALILATSGTTSKPKLVVHTQASICRHAADVAANARIGGSDAVLLAVPVSGAYGFTSLIGTLQSGAQLVMVDAFDPVHAGSLIRHHGVTHVLGTNDMLDKLLASAEGARPFPSLALFGYAAFVPGLDALPELAERRGVPIRAFYGMSELLAGFATQPADAPLKQRALAGGTPVCSRASFSIRDPETGAEVPRGVPGELVVNTPNKLREYLDNPDATRAACTPDGHFRTGDLAYAIDGNSFVFVSRMGDVLRIGGYLVAPAEIEELIAQHPGIRHVQVVEATVGNAARPIAFVVLDAGQTLDEAQLMQSCRSSLATYKVPVRVFAIDEIPMLDGPNGRKVQRSVLRARAEELLAATLP